MKRLSMVWAKRIGFVALALRLATASLSAAEPFEVTKVDLRMPGGLIRAERFEGHEPKKRPVVVVLHGAGGVLFDGPEMRRMARYLAGEGNAVYLLPYFQRTGTIFAVDSTMQRHFSDWLEAVKSSIAVIKKMRGDERPVGIFGYSLGGFLALAAASDNPSVGAVVEQAGGVWNNAFARLKKMPPVLMVHGESDGRVPFAQYARPLLPILRARARRVETQFFRGEGHVFTQAALIKVRPATANFFRRELR